MKVLLINNTFGNFGGGSEKATYQTGKLLEYNGHQVYYFASDRKPFYEENYAYQCFFPEALSLSNISMLKKVLLLPRIFYNYEAKRKLNSLLKNIKPDIVHINCIQYNITSSVIFACKENNIPTVMTLHDSCFACPALTLMKKGKFCHTKDCIKGNPTSCLINRCFNNSLPKSLMASAEYVFKRSIGVFNIPEYLICPSQFILSLAEESGIKREKLAFVPNFINTTAKAVGLPAKNYFLYAGRIVQEKGLHYLINAFKELPEIELRIAGIGAYEEELKKVIKHNNIQNISFIGLKTGQELEQEYENCYATILPSIGAETFGLTILETFAYGKPVIASSIGGITEVISDNIDGILVEPGNAQAIKTAVLRIWNNPELAAIWGKNARTKFENIYNPESYYKKLMKVYEKAIKPNPDQVYEPELVKH